MLPNFKMDLNDILDPDIQGDNWLGDQNIFLNSIVQTEILP